MFTWLELSTYLRVLLGLGSYWTKLSPPMKSAPKTVKTWLLALFDVCLLPGEMFTGSKRDSGCRCSSNVEDQPENHILPLKPLDLPTQGGFVRSNLPAMLSLPPERLRRCALKQCQLSAVSGADLPGELKRLEPPPQCSSLFEAIFSYSLSDLTR